MLSRSGPLPPGSGWSFELKWDGFRARIKLPKNVREEPNPPTMEHFLAILDSIGQKFRLR